MSKHVKTLTTEVIHENSRWLYKRDQIAMPDGSVDHYYYVEKEGGAVVVPTLADGRLVLVAQDRYLYDKLSIEFPRGAFSNETAERAARRELLEETGYVAEEVVKVGVFEPLNGSMRNLLHVFFAAELREQNQQKLDKDEFLEIIYRRPDEFEDMIRRGEIWDGPTLAAWAMAREHVLNFSV